MADSTTNLDVLSSGQASKEQLINALFDACSFALLFGRRAQTTTGLVWGYYGGRFYQSGAAVVVANGTITLPANSASFVEATTAGVVSSNTTAFTAGRIRIAKVTTGTSTITSYEDHRGWTLATA